MKTEQTNRIAVGPQTVEQLVELGRLGRLGLLQFPDFQNGSKPPTMEMQSFWSLLISGYYARGDASIGTGFNYGIRTVSCDKNSIPGPPVDPDDLLAVFAYGSAVSEQSDVEWYTEQHKRKYWLFGPVVETVRTNHRCQRGYPSDRDMFVLCRSDIHDKVRQGKAIYDYYDGSWDYYSGAIDIMRVGLKSFEGGLLNNCDSVCTSIAMEGVPLFLADELVPQWMSLTARAEQVAGKPRTKRQVSWHTESGTLNGIIS